MNWLDFGVTRSKVKGHRAHYLCENGSWSRYLKNNDLWIPAKLESCMYLTEPMNWLDSWGHEIQGQRSQGSLCMRKWLVIALSQELIDGFLPNLSHGCILQSQWTDLDFGVTRSKVKGHRAHYVCKIACDRIISRIRLMDSCQTQVMYVSCRANEMIRFWGHQVKGHRGLYVSNNSIVIALSWDQIDRLLSNSSHVCILQSQWTD